MIKKKQSQLIYEKGSVQKSTHCQACGLFVDKLYQNNMCKPCLKNSFEKLVRMIDRYRSIPDGRHSAER